ARGLVTEEGRGASHEVTRCQQGGTGSPDEEALAAARMKSPAFGSGPHGVPPQYQRDRLPVKSATKPGVSNVTRSQLRMPPCGNYVRLAGFCAGGRRSTLAHGHR